MRISLPLTALLLLLPTNTQAQLIYLKDGFVLDGKIKKENITVVDPVSGEAYNYPKFFLVDDGVRRFYFAPIQMQKIDEAFVKAEDTVKNSKPVPPIFPTAGHPGGIREIKYTGPWDEKWQRDFHFMGMPGKGKWEIKQQVTILNSHYAVVSSIKTVPLSSGFMTQELGPEVVRKLLGDHPDFQESPSMPLAKRLDRRFRLYHFYVHAGWLNQASDELDRIRNDFRPDANKRVDDAREKLNKLLTQRHLDDIRQAHRAGRLKRVRTELSDFPEKFASAKVVQEVRTLRASYDAADDKMKEAKQFLDELLKGVDKQTEIALFTEAIDAIKTEMHPDNIGRLELFVEQSKAAAKQRKAKGKVDLSESELLSLAVTGWMLGSAASEAKFATAKRLWNGRKLALEYCNAGEAGRGVVFNKFDLKDCPTVDEMLLMLPTLPPIKPDQKLPEDGSEQKTANGKYMLQLPDEYHPGRSYPVMMVLHGGMEESKTIMERVADKARAEGYILAAPTWGFNTPYKFNEEAHQAVLETLHDLRKRFNVDSDRVFLFGWGAGATMACDVGMSHPDLFAGVIPMCPGPEYFARHYWPNAQYLPFYTVTGDVMGPESKQVRDLYERWVQHGYPAIHVQYKGRGVEWYAGELPTMFDWMSHKKRNIPVTQLGRFGQGVFGDEFVSFRPTDNRFYWITTDKIHPSCVQRVPGWRGLLPATMAAIVQPGQNQIIVKSHGWQHVTVWLARDARLDFDKKIMIRINGGQWSEKVTPSLSTLLEDFAYRLDRQRLFVARVDFKIK